MNQNTEFLKHIKKSSEMVSAWPSWKTAMWKKSIIKNKTIQRNFFLSREKIIELQLLNKRRK